MTATTPDDRPLSDGEALWLAVWKNPDDDAVALAFADHLDETAGRMPCPRCDGGRKLAGVDREAFTRPPLRPKDLCVVCHGESFVPDDRADRAEFIRIQCGWVHYSAVRQPMCKYGLDHHGPVDGHDAKEGHPCPQCNPDSKPLVARERELRERNPAWSQCPCPGCGGVPWHDPTCPVCNGTSDLFQLRDDERLGYRRTEPRTLTFRRGCPDAVSCTRRELAVPCPGCDRGLTARFDSLHQPIRHTLCRGTGHVPARWARAVGAACPTLTRLVLPEFVPRASDDYDGEYFWSQTPPAAIFPHRLPPFLWDGLDNPKRVENGFKYYDTPAAATDALAKRACRFARG